MVNGWLAACPPCGLSTTSIIGSSDAMSASMEHWVAGLVEAPLARDLSCLLRAGVESGVFGISSVGGLNTGESTHRKVKC